MTNYVLYTMQNLHFFHTCLAVVHTQCITCTAVFYEFFLLFKLAIHLVCFTYDAVFASCSPKIRWSANQCELQSTHFAYVMLFWYFCTAGENSPIFFAEFLGFFLWGPLHIQILRDVWNMKCNIRKTCENSSIQFSCFALSCFAIRETACYTLNHPIHFVCSTHFRILQCVIMRKRRSV